jgi:hypothetical protein
MKIMPNLQADVWLDYKGKLILTEKGKSLNMRKFLIHFSVFQCTGHQPIWVADLG